MRDKAKKDYGNIAKVIRERRTLGIEKSSRLKEELVHDSIDTYNLVIAAARWSQFYGYPLGIYRPDPIGSDIMPDALMWRDNGHCMAIFGMSTIEEYNNFKFNIYPSMNCCVGDLVMVVAMHGLLNILDFPDLLCVEFSHNKQKSYSKKWLGHFKMRGTDRNGQGVWCEIDEDTELWLPDLENRKPAPELATLFLSFSLFAVTTARGSNRYLIKKRTEEEAKTFPCRYKMNRVAEQFVATKEYIRNATGTPRFKGRAGEEGNKD